ncbi:nacht and ankyrin domain protein [Colletotrichum truncatum]|uniref:Nacht and ankyrin domain protein n=1 Tax=Colletotrichum truncatum TaxID=5467 RepID=A0ACC3YRT7_COLTU|nr:nacht and ankyrin domain protein [Colletotrichum truncatum]KAF6799374.1 nacht and ankyrin domain protein [Colletotrichum truncatum]
MDHELSILFVQIAGNVFIFILFVLAAYPLASFNVRSRIRALNRHTLPKAFGRLLTIKSIRDTWSILFDTETFLRGLQKEFQGSLVPLSLPGRCLSIALPGKAVRDVFRNSREFTPVPGLLDALVIFFGLTSADVAIFDHSHIASFEEHDKESHKTDHIDPSRRIIEHQRRDFLLFLTGDSLKSIIEMFSRNFRRQLQHHLDPSKSLTQLPDVYRFFRDLIFKAEVEALYGKHLFSVCPSFCEDFWEFYEAFPIISRGLPKWLFPSQYRKRDKLLAHFQCWRRRCHQLFDWTDDNLVNCDYEPIWGTHYIRRMVRRHEKLGFSDEGISTVMLGYLFVTTANTIPAATWMILHTFLDKPLLSRMRHELSINGSETALPRDAVNLGSAPLLNSVYRETLRLHIAGATGRTRATSGFGPHQGSKVTMTASWLGGLDTAFWNQGHIINGGPEHSVEIFWAERFLRYPDDTSSGPILIQKETNISPRTRITSAPKTIHDDAKAKLVNSGLQGHWFPFGGGAWRCPGEALAKSTILTSVALLLNEFNIDIVNEGDALEVTRIHKHRTLPFGTHAFNKPVPVQISRRA